jgi:malate synthase
MVIANMVCMQQTKETPVKISSLKGSQRSHAEIYPRELEEILTDLHLSFERERQTLLKAREEKQNCFDNGELPRFSVDHFARKTGWKVAPIPDDLLDRRVEITGPVHNKKMVINMLSPGEDYDVANTAMLDFEDSMKPTWENVISGIENVIGVADGTLEHEAETEFGKKIYKLNPKRMARPMIRVRGLHLIERNVVIHGLPVAAGMHDLAVTAYHTAKKFIRKGFTPKFYVPKCEHHLEARWWNEVFQKIEQHMGLPTGTLKVTFLIETLPAAYQMEEILYEIRERACALNGGRWDKIFSDIKTLKKHRDRVLADRAHIDMTKPWMDAYAKHLIKVCHKRGALALGGMAAHTPGQSEDVRREQTEKVVADKRREFEIGHDGCWVSHPYFVKPAKDQFLKPNQLDVMHADLPSEPDLLPLEHGPKTLNGLRQNIRVGIAYQKAWNEGHGCIAFENLMEDLATLEISRAQVWQWVHHNVKLDDGTLVTKELVAKLFEEECEKVLHQSKAATLAEISSYHKAKDQIRNVYLSDKLSDFYSTLHFE